MTINDKLYKLRIAANLSQKEFADKVGSSQSAINYWENGKRQPRTVQLKKIAAAFDIPLYTLTDDDYEVPDISDPAYKKRAKFVNEAEMETPPKLFTVPMGGVLNSIEIPMKANDAVKDMATKMLMKEGEKDHNRRSNQQLTAGSWKPSAIAISFTSADYTNEELEKIKEFAEFIKSNRKSTRRKEEPSEPER